MTPPQRAILEYLRKHGPQTAEACIDHLVETEVVKTRGGARQAWSSLSKQAYDPAGNGWIILSTHGAGYWTITRTGRRVLDHTPTMGPPPKPGPVVRPSPVLRGEEAQRFRDWAAAQGVGETEAARRLIEAGLEVGPEAL